MIIYYHRIKNNNVSCSLKKFKKQLQLAKKYGWTLHFDDGLKEHYTVAFPLLKLYGLKATFFPIMGCKKELKGKKWKGQKFMNWKEIKELYRNGMVIGCHSYNHIKLGNLTKEQQEKEIRLSTEMITKEIEKPTIFCYPFGSYNKHTIELLKKYGYKYAVINESQNMFEINRVDTNEIY